MFKQSPAIIRTFARSVLLSTRFLILIAITLTLFSAVTRFASLFSALKALNKIVTRLLRGEHHHHHNHGGDITPPGDDINHTTKSTDSIQSNAPSTHQQSQGEVREPQQEGVSGCICCSEDPAKDLESLKHMAEEVQHSHDHESHDHGGHDHFVHQHDIHESNSSRDSKSSDQEESDSEEKGDGDDEHDEAKLMRMSINTALAIGLHNFPEVGCLKVIDDAVICRNHCAHFLPNACAQ